MRREIRPAMTRDEFDAFCAGLPRTTHVAQWGDASVWKIAAKVFAIGGWSDGPELAVTFKCSAMSYDLLRDHPGLRPAPYLASRGLLWIQRTDTRSMNDATLGDYLRASYALVVAGLPKRRQGELSGRAPR